MKFTPSKSTFGRHETFQLRYGWLTKGYQALKTNPKVFESDNATVALGVGKNMVASIRYWMRATGMLAEDSVNLTSFADYLFDENNGVDPYLEDEATIWLIHWKLASNPTFATSWYWFFNEFHKPYFTGQEVQTALIDFTKKNIKNKVAVSTLKNDATVVTRMYVQSRGNTRTPMEEALDSPLASLGLISQNAGGRSFQSQPAARPDLPLGVVGFAVAELMNFLGKNILPVEEFMYSRDHTVTPGAVFRLSESDLTAKLERLVDYIPGVMEINETAGIHQLYLKRQVEPVAYLDKHYRQSGMKERAA